jgi:hypothetical protein
MKIPGFSERLQKEIQPIIEDWIKDEFSIEPATVYGIRSYNRGAMLKMHHDRIEELHVGVTLCIDDKGVKTPWPLNCISPRRSNEEHKIICNPGEMIIYENITVEHGRKEPLDGDWVRNLFVHWKLSDWKYKGLLPTETTTQNGVEPSKYATQ